MSKGVGIAVASGRHVDTDTESDTYGQVIGGREYTSQTVMMPNTATSSVAHTVSIGTNSASGMKLTVADKNTNPDLIGNDAATTHIAPLAGALTAGTAGWNISSVVGEDNPQNLNHVAMVASDAATPITVYTGNSAEEKDISMIYNFATNANQPAGVYTDVITYSVSAL